MAFEILPPALPLPALLLGLSFSLNVLLLARQFQPKVRRTIARKNIPEEPLPDQDGATLAELQTRFILMVSHEYRTPLTTILTTTELLERYGNKITDPNKQRYTQRIKQSVQHLIQLLNNTLLLDGDSIPLLLQPLELTPFCHSLLQESQQRIDNDRSSTTDHRLIHHFDNLPPEPIATDEQLLRQILSNLLSNAIKFSPLSSSNPHPIVKFEALYQPFYQLSSLNPKDDPRHDGLLIFKITDFGIGIPDRDRTLIFDRFYRGSNIGTIGGTGLGLNLAKSSIDRLGGTLQITSQEHQGTIVRVSLPIRHAQATL